MALSWVHAWIAFGALLALGLGYFGALRLNLTKDQKERRALLHKIAPFVQRRKRDKRGAALRRAAYLAWASRKITKRERDLFLGRRIG
jgi:hypothetical protein